jgi:hypothetical protein
VIRPVRRVLWLLLPLIILFALAPVLSAFIASAIASAAGCTLSGAGSEPCLIGGADWGATLSFMFTLHWFGLITLPLGAMALAVWLVAMLVVWWRGRRV